jgi:filamentous hemagglutinin family protein
MGRLGAIESLSLGLFGLLNGGLLLMSAANAQTVTADNTTDTQIDLGLEGFAVTGGTVAGSSLFHSFDSFSPGSITTEFDLSDPATAGVSNIFSRVTGSAASLLDGPLRVVGAIANPTFFLLNPNGVLIGPSAEIDIPGSVLITTANSISFEDGTVFAASDMAASPLLSISAPVGLQFGAMAEPIAANGRVSSDSVIAPPESDERYDFTPDTTLTLLGGSLDLTDAYFAVPAGRIQLGSVGPHAQVGLDAATQALTYSANTPLQDIQLNHSGLSVSGLGGGDIQVIGRQLQMNSSILVSDTFGNENGGLIALNLAEQIGIADSGIAAVVFPTQTGPDSFEVATGEGSSIDITTGQLTVEKGSFIVTDTYSAGDAGNVDIEATDVWLLSSALDGEPSDIAPVQIIAATTAEGQGGNLTIEADNLVARGFLLVSASTYGVEPRSGDGGDLTLNVGQLTLQAGAQIGTGTFGAGNSGELTVSATTGVDISGTHRVESPGQPDNLASSGIFVSANPDSTGNGGSLLVSAPKLTISQGGVLGAGTSGSGNAGNIVIHAVDISVADPVVSLFGNVSGIVATVSATSTGNGGQIDVVSDRLHLFNGGQITAATDGAGHAGSVNIRSGVIDIEGTSANGLFNSGISSRSSTGFDAGSVSLTGDRINIQNGGTVSVSNLASGNAGDINLSAGTLYLNQGTIQAEANAGSQGNLNIESRDVLLLRRGSAITTNATGTATGGNITIQSPVVIGLENSDISANAISGDGGTIRLTTQGLVGIAFRDQPTLESDITASSEQGMNGTVNIELPSVEIDNGLVQLPQTLSDVHNQVVASCNAQADDNQFVSTGQGGLPDSPFQLLGSNQPWQDFRAIALPLADDHIEAADRDNVAIHQSPSPMATDAQPPELLEASQWQVSPDGEVELIAAHTSVDIANRCLAQAMVASQ